MYAIEFWTKIKNGTIEIPREFQERLRQQLGDDRVRVIVLAAEPSNDTQNKEESDLIEQLLTSPLVIPDFTPLSRTGAYKRSGSS